jgi:hypothetical protein
MWPPPPKYEVRIPSLYKLSKIMLCRSQDSRLAMCSLHDVHKMSERGLVMSVCLSA